MDRDYRQAFPMIRWIFSTACFLCFSFQALSATYYVRKDGNDGNAGTTDTSGGAFLTVQQAVDTATTAGDIINVRAGMYPEEVVTQTSNGTIGSPITIDGGGVATIHRIIFDDNHDWHVLQNMRVSGYGEWGFQDANLTSIGTERPYVVMGADGGTVSYNSGTYQKREMFLGVSGGGNATENAGANLKFYGDDNVSIENASLIRIDPGADETVIDNCIIDGGSAVHLGGIVIGFGSGVPFGSTTAAASDCTIKNTEIHNLKYRVMLQLAGDNHVVEDCWIHDGVSVDFLRLWGQNSIIRDCVFENNYDVQQATGYHPDFLQIFGLNEWGSKGHVIERNIIKNIENGQLTDINSDSLIPHIRDITFQNNLIIDVALQASATIEAMKWYGNIFYRCRDATVDGGSGSPGDVLVTGWKVVETEPVMGGGDAPPSGSLVNGDYYHVDGSSGSVDYDGGNYSTGESFQAGAVATYTENGAANLVLGTRVQNDDLEIKGNIFLDCGTPASNSDGWYNVDPATGLTGLDIDYNYVAKGGSFTAMAADTFPPDHASSDPDKFFETNGINGGDPDFRHLASLDFHPLSGSILENAGVTITGLTVDFEEISRGTPPEIGPFEVETDDTYYVDPGGSDAAAGTEAAPFETIEHAESVVTAGDTVIINAGTYDEYVTCDIAGTSAKRRVRFVGVGDPVVRAMRCGASWQEFNGITFSRSALSSATTPARTWNAQLLVDFDSDGLLVKDCTFTGGVYAMTDDFVFDNTTNTVTSSSVDFVAAGFKVGGKVRFGASSIKVDGDPNSYQHRYDNADDDHSVTAVTSTVLTVDDSPDAFVDETLTPAWAVIYGGSGSFGIGCLIMAISGGVGPDGARITGCTFDDFFGVGVELRGTNHHLDHCTFTNNNSWWGIKPLGKNIHIHHNTMTGINQFLRFTAAEAVLLPPNLDDEFDFQVGFILQTLGSGFGGAINTQIYRNWWQDCECRWLNISEVDGDWILGIRDNVFVGVHENTGFGREYSFLRGNTFVKSGTKDAKKSIINGGGNDPAFANGIQNSWNIYAEMGSRASEDDEFYVIVDTGTDSFNAQNFVTSYQTNDWAVPANFVGNELSSIEGGDPLFVNIADPLGPDGLPFTQDDGLRPLATSAACIHITDDIFYGALAPIEVGGTASPFAVNDPISHFSISAISTGLGWKDLTTTYDPTWLGQLEWDRAGPQRPWDTPESFGDAGVQVTFDGSTSIDGLAKSTLAAPGTNAGISTYAWTTSDGGSQSGAAKTFAHTFAGGGTFTVTLVVTNTSAETDTHVMTYFVSGAGVSSSRNPTPQGIRRGILSGQ